MQPHNDSSVFQKVAVIVALVSLMGCGSDDTTGSGRINVRLVDGPSLELAEVNRHITSVEIDTDAGWRTLATPDVTMNLLALRGGISETLVAGATLPAGHYGQMRLVLGEGNSVKLADGTTADLTVPSGIQSGVKFVVSFDVADGTTADVFIDFDAHRSIQVHRTGKSSKYILRPTIRAFDRAVTGSISGRLIDADHGTPLAGATVMAETTDFAGDPAVVRSTITGADGGYTIDLLPLGATYHVVTQPVVGGVAFEAVASQALALGIDAPLGTFDIATHATLAGTIVGRVSPVAEDQVDVVDLTRAFAVDAGTHTFIVRSAIGVVSDGEETFAFDHVPVGLYGLLGTRETIAADGQVTFTHAQAGALAMTANAVLDVTLAF